MILEFYKVICDDCGEVIKEFPYYPEEPDLIASGITVYNSKVFCCEECLTSYKELKKK